MKTRSPETPPPASNIREFFKRLRIGVALIVGYLLGSWLRMHADQDASEFFVGGFGAGVILTQGVFWIYDWLMRRVR